MLEILNRVFHQNIFAAFLGSDFLQQQYFAFGTFSQVHVKEVELSHLATSLLIHG